MRNAGLLPWVRTIVFFAISVLIFAGTGFLIGRRETIAFPSALSEEPSGVSALRAYCARLGYRTEVSRRSSLPMPARATVIAFYPGRVRNLIRQDKELDYKNQRRKLLAYARAGNTVVLIGIPFAFSDRSALAYARKPAIVTDVQGRPSKVIDARPSQEDTWDGDASKSTGDLLLEDQAVVFASEKDRRANDPSDPFVVTAAKFGRGRILTVSNGLAWTNRFLSDHDHAAILSGILRVVAPKNAPVVFLEGTFNPQDPGLLDVLGPWARSVLNQSLFVLIVIGIGLGRYLGMADTTRRTQRGQRELLDGLSDFLHRVTDRAQVAEVMVQQAEYRLRSAKILGREDRLADRIGALPPDVQSSYATMIHEANAEPVSRLNWLTRRREDDPFFVAVRRFDRAVNRATGRSDPA